jgi:predicted nuclease with TOPRIM domain
LARTEREIAQLEGRVNELSDALAIASADQDLDAVARLGEEYERLQGELDQTYQRWETLTDERELVLADIAE